MSTGDSSSIVIYAQDGLGFGHAARAIKLAAVLRRAVPEYNIVLATGCPLIAWAEHLGFEVCQLRPFRTVWNGRQFVESIDGSSSVETGISERMLTFERLLLERSPITLIVDVTPRGKRAELAPLIARYRENGVITRLILGLRPIVGHRADGRTPIIVSEEWKFVEKYYDECWVYGSRHLYGDHVPSQAIETCRHIHYVGALRCEVPGTGSLGAGGVLVNLGAHDPADGNAVMQMVYSSMSSIRQRLGSRAVIRQSAIGTPSIDIVNAMTTYLSMLQSSALCVCFGGTNTLWDVVERGITTISVARSLPYDEQRTHIALLAREDYLVKGGQVGCNLAEDFSGAVRVVADGWCPKPVAANFFADDAIFGRLLRRQSEARH